MSKVCFSYADGTFESVGATIADEDPLLPGVFHAPRNTTDIAPPAIPQGQQAIFTDGAWSLVPDHRGETWFDGVLPVRVDLLGDPTGFTPALSAAPVKTGPDPVPDISDRQFAAGLWGDGIISYNDFLGFIGPGTIPAAIQTIVNGLPDDDTGAPTPRKNAVGFLTGSKLYQFAHPLVEFFREAMAKNDAKWTEDFLRARWEAWATL